MFKMNLVTPEKKLATDVDVEEIILPGFRGQLNILPGHAPLMTTMTTGILKYKLKGENNFQTVAVSWGYCEVFPKGINILAETAEAPEEIDVERAQEALKKATEKLTAADLPVGDIIKLQRKAQRAQVRIHTAD